MAAIAPIVILDGQAVPVSHTFNPITSGVSSLFRESITNLALIGQGWLGINVKKDNGNGLNKVILTLDLPALEVITGSNSSGYSAAPKIGYENKAVVTFFLPSRATSQQRKDLRVLLANSLLNAQVIDVIENVVAPY